ncbi:MAG: GHKL domain-containing protein [Lachnospiraceae bacterium]|nr:GHKL domain-containing protein [Lachnospiraceae bacterium]
MIDIIICVSTNLFRVYLIRRFMQIFFGCREEGKVKQVLAYGGFFFINTVTYLAFHLVWVNIICNLAGISLIVLLYTKSIKMNLFVTCSIYLINIGCDTVSTLPFIDYRDGESFTQIYAVISVFFIFICELFTEKIINERKDSENVQNFSLVLVPLCSIIMLCLLIYINGSTVSGLVIISVGLLMANFLIFYLYNMLSRVLSQKYENEALRQKILNYSNQIEIMLQGEEKVKALRHDMKHHMSELKLMAMKHEDKAIQKYIDDMGAFMENPNEIVSSGNVEIDSVLNYMLQRAKEELRIVNVKMQIPAAVSHFFDLNVILGNLLENAIEAAMQTEEKQLDVSIKLKQGVMWIKIENSFNGRIKRGQNGLLTTKEKKEQHGIGLSNVKKIVEKYNGIMEICSHDNLFCVKLILYMSKIQNV